MKLLICSAVKGDHEHVCSTLTGLLHHRVRIPVLWGRGRLRAQGPAVQADQHQLQADHHLQELGGLQLARERQIILNVVAIGCSIKDACEQIHKRS